MNLQATKEEGAVVTRHSLGEQEPPTWPHSQTERGATRRGHAGPFSVPRHLLCSGNHENSRLPTLRTPKRDVIVPATARRPWGPLPASAHRRYGFEAARRELVGARVAPVDGPVEKVDLVGIEFQQQDDHLAAQLMNLSTWRQAVTCVE